MRSPNRHHVTEGALALSSHYHTAAFKDNGKLKTLVIVSDVNMAYGEHARQYLADRSLPRECTYVADSPKTEVPYQKLKKIESSDIHQRLCLLKKSYILISTHREENVDTEKDILSFSMVINGIALKYDMPILHSCIRKHLEQSGLQSPEPLISGFFLFFLEIFAP